MRKLRDRLPGHATVVTYLALFLALTAGAMAAATIDSGDVVNGSLKSVDLKNNAGVKGSDVRNNSLRGGDVRNGQLTGAQVADNSIRGADTNEPALELSQRVAQLGGVTNYVLPTPIALAFPNNTYTQSADESNVWIGGGRITFPAACTSPRSATIYLLADGTTLATDTLVGFIQIIDNGVGSVTRHFDIAPFAGGKGTTQVKTGAPVPHTFYVIASAACNSGAGVTLDSVGVDVVAER